MEDEKLNNDIPDSVIIKYLIRDNKKLLQELGKERSYIEELEDNLEKERNKSKELRDCSNSVKKELKKDELYNNLKIKIKNLETKNKKLTDMRDQLCYKISKYRQLLIDNNLLK